MGKGISARQKYVELGEAHTAPFLRDLDALSEAIDTIRREVVKSHLRIGRTLTPPCKCHGEPQWWSRSKTSPRGGTYRCAVKERERNEREPWRKGAWNGFKPDPLKLELARIDARMDRKRAQLAALEQQLDVLMSGIKEDEHGS